jgi:hypothetical protein
MAPIPLPEIEKRVKASPLYDEYAQAVDRESAREVLQRMVEEREGGAGEAPPRGAGGARGTARGRGAKEPSAAETVAKALNSPMARTVGRELVRGLFSVLGVRTTTRRRRTPPRLW